MKISDARTVMRTAAANAGDSTPYTDATLDQAIIALGDDLAKKCELTLTVAEVTLSEGDDTLPDIDDDFREERMRALPYLEGDNVTVDEGGRVGTRGTDVGQNAELEVWDMAELVTQAQMNSGLDGQPVAIAFEDATSGRCYPIPDDDYTLRIPWLPPFTRWTRGTALLLVTRAGTDNHIASISVISGGSGYLTAPAITQANTGGGTGATATATVSAGRITAVSVGGGGGSGYGADVTALINGNDASDLTLNVPADYLETALIFGGTAMLQFSDLKRRFGSSNWQRYQDFLKDLVGKTQAPRRRKTRPRDGWTWSIRRKGGG